MTDMLTATPRFNAALVAEAVPRYTSYPPANHFSDATGETQLQGWIEALDQDASLALYLHIPFCRQMCWYCGCNTTVPNKDRRVARYLEALDLEIRNRGVWADGRTVRHVHFGGGSPDMLSPERFQAIMRQVRASFALAPDAEIAVELDPRGITPELAAAMARGGVNRASLGVQDLSLEVQELIHRVQPESVVIGAMRTLRAAGIERINLDIMYGLPAQTVERVEETARKAAAMDPDRIAVFGYAHVPWFKKHQNAIPAGRLPDAAERFDQMMAAARILQLAGYDAIGFDHFARPADPLARAAREGRLRRNFQGYTDAAQDALIGLGASSISDAPGGYAQNIPDPTLYSDAVLAGAPVAVRGLARGATDTRIGRRIETLMCDFTIAETELDASERDALRAMADMGLVDWSGGNFTVTPAGRPYIRNIAARLDPAFVPKQNQHSLAV
tara:strand:+ start:20281 stop:21618 length:1338 start_codon:yes stop_codon:yes gene_type:complete